MRLVLLLVGRTPFSLIMFQKTMLTYDGGMCAS